MEFTYSVTLAQATGKGRAVSHDGTLCEGIGDTFAGITAVSGASGDLVTLYCMGSLIPCVNGGSAVTAGATSKSRYRRCCFSGSAVADGDLILGFAQTAAAAGDTVRVLINGPESVRVP
jgi:hypothetical protein